MSLSISHESKLLPLMVKQYMEAAREPERYPAAKTEVIGDLDSGTGIRCDRRLEMGCPKNGGKNDFFEILWSLVPPKFVTGHEKHFLCCCENFIKIGQL